MAPDFKQLCDGRGLALVYLEEDSDSGSALGNLGNEDFVAPHTGFGTHPHRDMEIITYVLGGAADERGHGRAAQRDEPVR
jgi:redox-sensitive bicupin YhaK (pirin superfamily)